MESLRQNVGHSYRRTKKIAWMCSRLYLCDILRSGSAEHEEDYFYSNAGIHHIRIFF